MIIIYNINNKDTDSDDDQPRFKPSATARPVRRDAAGGDVLRRRLSIVCYSIV